MFKDVRRLTILLAPFLVLPLLTGCLSNSYQVSGGELRRIAKLSHTERAENIRVLQDRGYSKGPTNPPGWAPYYQPPEEETYRYTADYGYGDAWLEFFYPDHVHSHHRSWYSYGYDRPPRRGLAGHHKPKQVKPPKKTSAKPKPKKSESKDKSGKEDGEALAVFLVVAVVALTVGLIATEGIRYDGWVEVDPNHPLYITDQDGSERMLYLSDLTEDDVATAKRAELYGSQGAGLIRLHRAPLNRVGLVWALETGPSQVHHHGRSDLMGPMFRWNLGMFPTHNIGILGEMSFVWADDATYDVFDFRYGVQARAFLPLRAPAQLGGYISFGNAHTYADVISNSSDDEYETLQRSTLEMGAIVEFDLTTTLGLTLRAGHTRYGNIFGTGTPAAGGFSAGLGLAVY
ncbi:MAG: hypothetical protein CMH54_13935 [Myxococcales bacterium]|nr:hypothetical protein [Myxococcales bacterium]|tara:strand:+ start:255 stop:1460 length:1206 start_codon:yes stop_codon:yes gene_type:complete